MSQSRSGSFADILARLEGTVSPHEADIPPVVEAVRAFRDRLAGVSNVGRTGDEHDLYVLLDQVIAAVKASYPGSLCQAGCSGCCESHVAVFDASETEWQLIAEHLGTWPEAEVAALADRFDREHAPQVRAYKLLGAVRHFEPVADRYFEGHPYRCPFLVEGRCSIYAVRPLACRMYGHFAIRARWYAKPSVYACNDQTRYYHGLREERPLTLPTVNMLAGRMRRLFRGRARILPLWLDRWLARRPV